MQASYRRCMYTKFSASSRGGKENVLQPDDDDNVRVYNLKVQSLLQPVRLETRTRNNMYIVFRLQYMFMYILYVL